MSEWRNGFSDSKGVLFACCRSSPLSISAKRNTILALSLLTVRICRRDHVELRSQILEKSLHCRMLLFIVTEKVGMKMDANSVTWRKFWLYNIRSPQWRLHVPWFSKDSSQITKWGDSVFAYLVPQYWNNQILSLMPLVENKVCSAGLRYIHPCLSLRMEAPSVLFIRDAPTCQRNCSRLPIFHCMSFFFPLPINLPLLNEHYILTFLCTKQSYMIWN